MSRIDTLQIHNFKFFNEQKPIKLDGKHLLLYGENGSGKSSIYWALYTLFEASLKNEREEIEKYFRDQTNHDQSLINIHANCIPAENEIPEHYNSFVSVKTTHDTSLQYEVSLLNTDIIEDTVAKEINYASDFITYKVLYKFQDFWNGAPMNLADIFIGYILPYINFPAKDLIRDGQNVDFTNASEMYEEIKKGPGTTTSKGKDKSRVIQVYKYSEENKKFNAFVKHFNDNLQELIDFVNVNAPIILKELGYDIGFELRLTNLYHNKKDVLFEFSDFKIEFVITSYLGKQITINRPQSFLNEAKITAIAVAIRLTILKKRINKEAGDILKFIVFDDVMISLDMNNRDKLIDYLLNPLNGYTTDYQLLFLTHDKAFFDFVGYKIKKWDSLSNWKLKEMYVGEKDNKEFPVIIDSELEYIDKAKKYFKAKDYVVTSLYLRKEFEKVVIQRLPKEYTTTIDGTFHNLAYYWKLFREHYKKMSLDMDVLCPDMNKDFEQSKTFILNSQAHHNISVPVYTIELKKVFSLIKDINNHFPFPETTLVLSKGTQLKFSHPTENYSIEFELLNDLKLNKIGVNSSTNIPNCNILTWQFNNIEYWDFKKGKKLNTIPKPTENKLNFIRDNLTANIFVPLNITDEMFLTYTIIQEGIWSLKELLDKSNITL